MLDQLLEKFNSEQFDSVAVNLRLILYDHFRRISQFHRALITGSWSDDYGYEDHGNHRTCPFGQWYYSQTAPELKQNKEFVELGKVHEDLHGLMRDLLHGARNDRPITADRYDLFLTAYYLFTDRLMQLIQDINFAQFQFDHLTNLLNRRAFNKKFEYEFNMVRRNKRPCIVALADIDHFKNINDSYGRANGDVVLKSIAGFFLKQLRGYDTVGRFGGEEFIFCLPNTALPAAKKIMERLRKTVGRMRIRLSEGSEVRVTISIGMAELQAAGTVDLTLQQVHEALHRAKNSGRNRVEVSAES